MSVKSTGIALEVISPERTLVRATVDSVELPGTKGRFEVLLDHAPLISSLEKGVIAYRNGEGTDRWRFPLALWKLMIITLSLAWNCDEKVDLHIHWSFASVVFGRGGEGWWLVIFDEYLYGHVRDTSGTSPR